MKTLNFSYTECVRLALILRSYTGSRKDVRTRTILGLIERLGVKPEKLAQYVKPIDGQQRVILDLAGMAAEPAKKVQVTAEEARVALELLDGMQVGVEDILAWVDPLAKKLEAVCA